MIQEQKVLSAYKPTNKQEFLFKIHYW